MSPKEHSPSISEQETVAAGEWSGLLRIAMETEEPSDNSLFAADPSDYANQPGQTIGPYTLIQKLGEGGFGLVWLAEQTTPIRRQVALKVIKVGMDTLQVVARFNAERQTLALMDHPGIASVFDAGTTTTGRPYFVMELVHGLSILTYCQQHQLSFRDRLLLFVEVCKAVQHAHQKGVIHRDLKPANVLVVDIDGKPQPKIIDFGISKALQSDSSSEFRLATRGDVLLGTPEYMSPEQAIPGNSDLDTRTDIYSLGVVLHELLTGQTPQGSERENSATFLGRLQRRTLADMRLPSTLKSTASNPPAEPDFARSLRGDLDRILLKALAHNRSDRYESADSFAADILNHLADRPITAGKPSLLLISGKFIRRNRIVVSGIAALFVVLAIATVLTAMALFRESKMRKQAEDLRAEAETQIRKSEQTLDFLTKLLERTEGQIKKGKNPEALRLALEDLQIEGDNFSLDPDVNQAIAGRTSQIFRTLRDDSKAHHFIAQQVQSLEQTHAADDPELLNARESYARTLYLQGQISESHRQYDSLVRYWQSQIHTRDGPRKLFLVRRSRADVWAKTGRLNEALKEFEDIRSTATDEIRAHSSWPVLLRTHATALTTAGKLMEAAKTYSDVLQSLPLDSAEQLHEASTIYQSQSRLQIKTNDIPGAIASLQKAIELQSKARGKNSPWVADWLIALSRLLTAQDQNTEAIEATRKALSVVTTTAQSDRVHLVHRALGDNFEAAGLHQEAAKSYTAAAEIELKLEPIPGEAWRDQSRSVLHTALAGKLSQASAMARSLNSIRITWADSPDRSLDLSQIETVLAFLQIASAESRSNSPSRTSVNKVRQLGLPIVEEFRIRQGRENSLPLSPQVLSAMELAAKPKNQGFAPTSADLLALDQALNDRWLGEDLHGELFELAAALRVTGQPKAAIDLYEVVSTLDPAKSPVRSRNVKALVLSAETWLQLGDKAKAFSILNRLNESHKKGETDIKNTALLNRITHLLKTGDPRPFKFEPKQNSSPPRHPPAKDASPTASPSVSQGPNALAPLR